jgi:hypothetical protein
MTIQDYLQDKVKYFIAMEYYALILNRTFVVMIDTNFIVGIKINGVIASKGSPDFLTGIEITSSALKALDMIVEGDLGNPHHYWKYPLPEELRNEEISSDKVLANNKSNFRIAKNEIQQTYYDPKKKWGMGEYKHDGKVYVVTKDNKRREFIVLGNQSGKLIADLLATN